MAQPKPIGSSLYMELLENAVDALKAGREPSLEDLTSQQQKSSCGCRRYCQMISFLT
ncbi:hypothetical protein ACNKHV_06855 [Shigella flexneri]